MKIDHHVHSDTDDPQAVRQFVATLEESGTIACISGGDWSRKGKYPGNAASLRIARQYPDWIVPFAWIDLGREAGEAGLVERLAEQGFRGFKFIVPWYEYDHDFYMPIYEKIEELGLPTLFHTGLYRCGPNQAKPDFRRPLLRNMHPLTLDRVARAFPRLPVIMAHMGTSIFRQEGAEMTRITANIFADLGGNGNWGSVSAEQLQELLVFKYCYGSIDSRDKLMLGSDAYISRPDIIVEAQKYYSMLIPEQFQSAVFGGNIAPYLGIKL